MSSKKKRTTPKKSKPNPKYQFRIYASPRTSPQYFDVMIHDNRKKMIKWRSENHSTCEAFMAPDNGTWITHITPGDDGFESSYGNPRLGAIHFHPGSLTMGIIVHELYHATEWYSHIVGAIHKDKQNRNEEIRAEVIGSLMAQFMVELNARKVLRNYQSRKEQAYYL